MIINNFKIAFRFIAKHKIYSIINILGLAVGFMAYMMISLFVEYEYSWDKHNENYDRIYRIQRIYTNVQFVMDGNNISPHSRAITTKWIDGKYSEVEKTLIIKENVGRFLSSASCNLLYDDKGYCAEQSLLDVFTYHFVEGDKNHALVEPFTIILSKTLAEKLFPKQNAVGKTVVIEKKYNVKVTGVYQDLPTNSHFRPSFIVSFSSLEKTNDERNSYSGIYITYVLLKKGTDYKYFENKITDLFKDSKFFKFEKLMLCPLSKVYLNFNEKNDYLVILSLYKLIGIFILILASFNYINLSTANISLRAKEIGVRKVFGSSKIKLVFQFLTESLIIALIALFFGFILTETFLPVYNTIINKDLVFSYTNNPSFIGQIVLTCIGIGLLSGLYPAWVMSSYKITNLFKGNIFKRKKEQFGWKKILVTIQFSITILLIVMSLFISSQIDYMMKKNIGFDRENLIYTKFNSTRKEGNFDELKNRILKHPEFISACMTEHIPFISFGGGTINWEGSLPDDKINVRYGSGSYDFVKTLGLKIIEGRDFSPEFPSDTNKACIINETARKNFGWENPIGKHINNNRWQVVGVVNDFYFKDMYNRIEPFAIVLNNGKMNGEWTYTFRIQPNTFAKAKKILTTEFEATFPDDPFEFQLLSYSFTQDNVFKVFENINHTIMFFTVLNILLAVIGLLGLVSFTIQRKTKEIGIRKINGCSSFSIFKMLCNEYFLISGISSIITIPFIYLLYNKMPGHDKYPFQLWEYIVGVGIILIVILATTSYQTYKAAVRNPVEALRYE